MLPNGFATPRLLLRPIEASDAPTIFQAYAQDPEVSRFLTWRPHTSIEDTRSYLASAVAAVSSRNYAIIERGSGALIGSFELRQAASWRLGYGYALARPFWGRGLMTEALTEVAGWALAQPGIWRISDVVDVDNPASARVMEKAGFVREGVLRRWGLHPNVSDEPRDCYLYARVRVAA